MGTPERLTFVSKVVEPEEELDDPWFRPNRPSAPPPAPPSLRNSGIVPRVHAPRPAVSDEELEESWFK